MKKRNWERVLMIYKKLELMIYTLSPFKSSTVVVGRNEESFLSGDESKRFANKVVKKYQYICHVVDL
jgi:hypothetical protein